MFETSVVQARPKAARGRFGLLSISIMAHSAIIVGVVAVSIASVDFPKMAPDEVRNAPRIPSVVVPPPLGDPNGGAQRSRVTPPAPPKQSPAPTEITAPPILPDVVPTVEAPTAGTDPLSDALSDGSVPGPVGQPWGREGSPGPLEGPPATDATPPGPEPIYEPVGDVKSPVLISRVDPQYPDFLRRTGLPATVVVRCVIDKNGRIRDPEIVVPAMAPFNEAVLNVLGHWRYKPGSRHGAAVETYMTLTVKFQINR